MLEKTADFHSHNNHHCHRRQNQRQQKMANFIQTIVSVNDEPENRCYVPAWINPEETFSFSCRPRFPKESIDLIIEELTSNGEKIYWKNNSVIYFDGEENQTCKPQTIKIPTGEIKAWEFMDGWVWSRAYDFERFLKYKYVQQPDRVKRDYGVDCNTSNNVYVYDDGYYIEIWNGEKKYLLIIGNMQYSSDNLFELERILFKALPL